MTRYGFMLVFLLSAATVCFGQDRAEKLLMDCTSADAGTRVAPKSAADFAFLLHGFHYLKDEGVMAIILPHGVLFRGGAEERIRTKLLTDGHIDQQSTGNRLSLL